MGYKIERSIHSKANKKLLTEATILVGSVVGLLLLGLLLVSLEK